MPRHSLEYPKEARNTVNRLGKKRATYDLLPIQSLIQTSLVSHVSFSPSPDDPFPTILPMIAVMGSFDRPSADFSEPLDCYLHGYVSSRIMNLARTSVSKASTSSISEPMVPGAASLSPEAQAQAEKDHADFPEGLPVCITSSKVDGLVVSLTPNSHSLNYRSATLFGYAMPLAAEALEEKLFAMELITNKIIPGRWNPDNVRLPPNKAEMQSTQILKVKIVNGSGKTRDGGPADELVDLGDEEVLGKVWTGFVPLKETFEEPVPGGYNKVEKLPEHIRDHISEFNEGAEQYVKKLVGNVKRDAEKKYGEV